MIKILETQITAKMNLQEAKALHRLLGRLPFKRNDCRLNAADFTPDEWDRLMSIYQVFDNEVGDKVL